jgi:16S rRNA (cytidine1402-2'-O)-methyltransferase
VPALVNSGFPCESFVFIGFLPVKKGRSTKLKSLQEETKTIILYESPYRLVKTLEELNTNLGASRKASVSRELTKLFEETKRGTFQELITYFSLKTVKGEIVIVVEGLNHKQQNGTTKETEA